MTHKLTLWQKAAVMASDFLLLLLGLYGTLFSFLSAFSLYADSGVLLRRIVLLALAALIIFSLPKAAYRLALSGASLLALGWVVREQFSTLRLGALTAAQRVSELFVRQVGLGLTAPDLFGPSGPPGLAAQAEAATLFYSVFLALLALWLGWAVAERRSFWLGFWGTFPLLLVPLTITITPDAKPLLALLLFWVAGLLVRLVKKADPWGSAKLILLTLPPAALLLVLTAAGTVGYYSGAEWVPSSRMAALDALGGAGQSIMASGGLSGLTAGGTDVNLCGAGPLHFTGTNVLRVQSEMTGHIYLRGFSAGVYTDRGWEQVDDALYEQAGGWAAQPINLPALLYDGPSYRFTIESLGVAPGYVYTPYQLATTPEQMTGAEFVHDAYLARGTGVRRYVLYAEADALPGTGAQLDGSAAEAEQAYRDFVWNTYLDAPPDLSEPLVAMYLTVAQAFFEDFRIRGQESGLPSQIIAAQAVALALAQDTVYDPDTPRTPDGEDFVEYFLTTSKRGYCMHYASAATLMLRAIGIPARYVTGYTADVKAGQTVSVPDENAHAWVEVYVDGYGWYPVEVTPGFSGQTAGESTPPSPTPSTPPTLQPSQQPLDILITPPPAPAADTGLTWDDIAPYVLPPVVLALAALLLLLWRRLAQRRRLHSFGGPDTNRAVIAMYLYAERLMRFRGGGELPPAPEILGQKAKFSQHTLTEDERGEMAGYVSALAAQTDEALPRWRRTVFRYVLGLY